MSAASVHLLRGNEPAVLGDAVRGLVDELVGDGDRSLMVEEVGAAQYLADDEAVADITPLVNAAQTPPFLTDRRVVVAHHVALFSTKDSVAPLVEYLGAPLDSTALVLVWEKGPDQQKLAAVPKSLQAAIAEAGGTVRDTSPPGQARQRGAWLADQATEAGVRLDREARTLLERSLGEDVGRVGAVLRLLGGTYGTDHTLSAAEVEPYLGEAGSVAPWDLTDAIDRGDVVVAIDCLHRLLGAGERNAVALLYTLHTHYHRMLALDGSGVTDEKSAAERLGTAPYPAKKAMAQVRRLGPDGIARAIELLADADLDVRGTTGWPPELVLEVLVARLAQGAARRR
jgi:DNA polymerase III subunit delta